LIGTLNFFIERSWVQKYSPIVGRTCESRSKVLEHAKTFFSAEEGSITCFDEGVEKQQLKHTGGESEPKPPHPS